MGQLSEYEFDIMVSRLVLTPTLLTTVPVVLQVPHEVGVVAGAGQGQVVRVLGVRLHHVDGRLVAAATVRVVIGPRARPYRGVTEL